MDLTAVLFLAAVLLVKEAGVPIPVPGDLLVIGAGVASTRGGLPVPAVPAVLVTATVVGGIIQFTLLRGRARATFLRAAGRFGLRTELIERGAGRLRSGGAPAVAGLIVGNGVFLTAHFALGLVVGEPAVQLVAGAGTTLVLAGVVLAVVGLGGWGLLARRRTAARPRPGVALGGEGLALLDWTDACCPACLALAAVERG
ncbi:MAG TPA: hypothetical protein VMH24_02320 [Candidatus Sulfotelmatobacter sp.]|nr:hypothetical protein [Candidatus Sulfotelmatobacter sp.]